MGNRPNHNLHWLWLSGVLVALGIFVLLSAAGVRASLNLQAQAGDHKRPLLTGTPSSTVPVAPSDTDTPAATSTLTTTATVQPTNTSYPTRTPSPAPTSCPIQFSDVPPGSTFYDYVRCLACRGIVSGYPDGTFRPNNLVTRGQACKIDILSVGFIFPIPPNQQTFEDVPPGSTFWLYIERAYERGIVTGYPCGGSPSEPCIPPQNRHYFRPNSPATRSQAAYIVERTSGFLEPPTGQTFEDVPMGSTFYTSVQILSQHNSIITGYPCGNPEPCVPPQNRPYFRPSNNTTRGQFAKMEVKLFYPYCATP